MPVAVAVDRGGVISAVMSSQLAAVCSSDIAIDGRRHVQSVTKICEDDEKENIYNDLTAPLCYNTEYAA